MTTFEFTSLRSWPGVPRTRHESDQFQSSYGSTVDLLEAELKAISVGGATVKSCFAKGSFRANGLPMENAKMLYPGMILSFDKRGQAVADQKVELYTDKYDDWKANLRGIALSLNALRGINRWGCSEQEQQYLGFPALPAPDPDALETADDAARFIARLIDPASEDSMSETLLKSRAVYDAMRPQVIKKAHPDQNGGENGGRFVKFQEAEKLLVDFYLTGK